MAVSTASTTLKYSSDNGSTFTKLVDIINYPDMGSTPNKLDTTDLSQTQFKTSILGLQELPDLTFECNYDETAYQTISALNATYKFKLEFGASGADGIFSWEGQIRVFTNGGGVDEVRKMTVVLSASTPITFATGA
jgi:hypothetical protein